MKGEVLTRREVSALLTACRPENPTGARNAALLAVLYRSGLRISEALALTPTDLNHAQVELRVRRGKGGRGRVVPIDAAALAFVDRWLKRRAELGAKRIDPLFCTLGCGRLASSYVRELLPRLAKRAELGRRVHPHAFRHTFSAELAREGVAMPQIQRWLGHARLDTTATYLASLVSPQELRRVARDRPSWLR